jgi:ATP-dependent helicase/nuclease subunit A
VVNLEKVVRTIGALASDGRLSSSDILERLESEGAFRSSEGDSPLADETVDAVRVLSVHKSKGLEWPVVILPNVAGDSGKGQERESVVVDVLAPRSLIVKSKRSQSPGYATFKKEKQLHEEAESRRLFYVAATRARQQLILAVGALDRGKPPWLEALGAWGYCLGSGRKWPEAESFMGGAVRHRVFEKVSEEDGRASATKLDEGLLDAVREFRQAREHASSFEDPFYHPGTELEENENDAEDAPPRPLLSGGRDRRLARAAGDTVHLLLEVWDRNDQAWLFDHVENAAVVAASRERVSTDDVASEARAILERARDDGQLRTLAGREVLGREMPILYRDDGGRLWEGKIDLLAGNPEQPEVLDYKTSRAQSVEELERKYEGQIKRYAEGVQRALDRKEPVPARIVHLPPKE